MATYTKQILSGSTDGQGIAVTAVANPGTVVHTAAASATTAPIDELYLWGIAYNSARTTTIQFAGTATDACDITKIIDPDDGLFPLVPGLPIKNAKVVRVFADATGVVIYGFANRISP